MVMGEGATRERWLAALGWTAGWAWTLLAGGGGLWLMFTRGPWPLTNGWYALGSGLSACPLTGVLLRRGGWAVTWRGQLVAAAGFFVAGHIHRTLQP